MNANKKSYQVTLQDSKGEFTARYFAVSTAQAKEFASKSYRSAKVVSVRCYQF